MRIEDNKMSNALERRGGQRGHLFSRGQISHALVIGIISYFTIIVLNYKTIAKKTFHKNIFSKKF